MSHQYVQVVPAVVLLRHPQRQHLLVQEQSAQVLLAGLALLLQLPLPQSLLLELALLGAFFRVSYTFCSTGKVAIAVSSANVSNTAATAG